MLIHNFLDDKVGLIEKVLVSSNRLVGMVR